MKARYLYSELSSAIQARLNCQNAMLKLNQNAVSASVQMHQNEYHLRKEWFDRWDDYIERLVREYMPSGSGFDNGTELDMDKSHANKLVFNTSFHHMDENGFYCGWTEHTVTVTPSFQGFDLRVSGRNRNDIKELIDDKFHNVLPTEIPQEVMA